MSEDDPHPFKEDSPEVEEEDPTPNDTSSEALHDAPPDPEDLAALQGWKPEATPGTLVALLPNVWVRRLVLGAIPTLALFFGSGLILASQLTVTHTLQVFGTATRPGAGTAKALQAGRVEALLVSGQENALRVAIWNRLKRHHERHFQAELTLMGGPNRVHRTLAKGVAGPGPALEATFALPGLAPGRYRLRVRGQFGEDLFVARVPARVVAPMHARPAVPIEPDKPTERPRSARPDSDDVTVEILPGAGHKVTTDLLDRLTVRATHGDGQPASMTGELRLADGRLLDAERGQRVGRPFATDALGLHDLRIVSRHPRLAFQLRYRLSLGQREWKEHPWRETVVRLERRNAQAVIEPAALLVRPGAVLDVKVYTLSSSGYVYLDLYSGGLRYHSVSLHVSGHLGRLRVPAPRRPGLFRIQVTDDFSNPGTGMAVRTLFATSSAPALPNGGAPDTALDPGSGAALHSLAAAVLAELPTTDHRTRAHLEALRQERLFDLPGVRPSRAAAYLLSRLDHLHHPTDWLCDTTTADARALAARKARLQNLLVVGLAFTALLLLALVGPLVWANVTLARRGTADREALMAEFEATAAEADLEAGLRARHDADGNELITDLRQVRADRLRMERLGQWMPIVMVIGIILLTIGATLLLLLRLSWGWS